MFVGYNSKNKECTLATNLWKLLKEECTRIALKERGLLTEAIFRV